MQAPTPDIETTWAEVMTAFEAGALSAGELACAFVVEHLRTSAGPRLLQARRPVPLPCRSAFLPARAVAERKLLKLAEPPARALARWADGRLPAVLRFDVPTPREMLADQARGRRSVSLLTTALTPDPLAFALHDLCHIEKFTDLEHHEGQIGFFASLERAVDDARWKELERFTDARWPEERDHVLSDMNGSAVYLFLALKARLVISIRRRFATEASLAEGERASEAAVELLLDLFELAGPSADAARALHSRRAQPEDLARLLAMFRVRGLALLRADAATSSAEGSAGAAAP